MTTPKDIESASASPSPWQVLESLGDSVKVVDLDYQVVWIKDPMLDELRPGQKIIGQPCYRAIMGLDEPCQPHCPVRLVFETGRPALMERQFTGPDGRQMWREARAFPIFDGTGRLTFVVRISFDITHRVKTQMQTRRRYESLERSLEELSRLQVDDLPFQPTHGPGLTKRELEVLRLVAQGMKKPQIAGVLGISPNTVKRHVSNIFDKLGVNDRAQAAVWAARQGLV